MNRMFTLVLAGAALTASSAMGAIVTYTDAAAFNASTIVGGTTSVIENFNTNSSIFTTFVAPGAENEIPGFSNGERVTRVVLGGYSEVVSLNSGNITAFGATWDLTPGGIGQLLQLTVNYAGGGSELVPGVLGSTVGNTSAPFFFGFTSTQAISSVMLSAATNNGSAETFSFDNLMIEREGDLGDDGGDPEPGVIPEPSTFGLLGVAMIGLGLVRRMRA